MQVFTTFAEVTGGGAKGRACDDNNPHSLQLRWNLPTYRRRVAHSVTVTYGPLCMFLSLYWYATIVEKVTTITCNTFNRYGSVAPWVSWGGICRVDIPAAVRAFCDSDLQTVMRVSLAFLICHDRWKGHHNCRTQIQLIWQRSAMHCKFFLELERRQLKEARGHTCSDQHVHSPLTFAFTEKQSNRAHGSYMQCHSNLWTATCLHCKYFLSWRGEKRKSHGSYIHGEYMQWLQPEL